METWLIAVAVAVVAYIAGVMTPLLWFYWSWRRSRRPAQQQWEHQQMWPLETEVE